ncbi:hypothetical protein [Dokdonella soli]|uniref:hypothetical protein n=1 Tax=Dokdonella soli TaxID=529810 RepID=UPI0031E0376E
MTRKAVSAMSFSAAMDFIREAIHHHHRGGISRKPAGGESVNLEYRRMHGGGFTEWDRVFADIYTKISIISLSMARNMLSPMRLSTKGVEA